MLIPRAAYRSSTTELSITLDDVFYFLLCWPFDDGLAAREESGSPFTWYFFSCSLILKGVIKASWSLLYVQDVGINLHPVNKGQEARSAWETIDKKDIYIL